jgi:hypothetical protein
MIEWTIAPWMCDAVEEAAEEANQELSEPSLFNWEDILNGVN